MGDVDNMKTSSRTMILASAFVVFGLVGPLTFWLSEQSSQASSSCTPAQKSIDNSAVLPPREHL